MWRSLGEMPRSSEELVRFGCRYTPGMAGHVYTGYGYFLAEYKYLYQVYFQKMFYKRLRCFLELIHNVTQMTPDDKSSKKCFQRSKKIQIGCFKVMGSSRYVLRLWVVLGMSKNHDISTRCGTVGVASLQVWPRIVVK